MKKILFTIQWYPSVRSANVLCDTNIIRELLKTGTYEVHCLVYKTKYQPKEEIIDGIHVHRFDRSWFWTEFIDSYKDTSSLKYKIFFTLNRVLLRIQQLLTIPIYPIFTPLLCRSFAKHAIRLHKNEHFDMVISEHNGIDTLMAGYELKKMFPDIIYLPILWDPLLGKEVAGYLPKSYATRKMKTLDNKIMSVADAVVSMTSNESFLRSQEVPYIDKVHFMGLPRFVRPQKLDAQAKHSYYKDGAINILYGGVISSRSIDYFIEVCNATGINNLNLIFLVSSPTPSIQKELSKFNGSYILKSYIPHDELLRLMQQCEYVLNIGGSNPRMIPSKIFEYMSNGKPIISTFFDDDDASLVFLRKYPIAHLLDTRKDVASESIKLRDFLLDNNGNKVEYDSISNIFMLNTPDYYVKMIEECFFTVK